MTMTMKMMIMVMVRMLMTMIMETTKKRIHRQTMRMLEKILRMMVQPKVILRQRTIVVVQMIMRVRMNKRMMRMMKMRMMKTNLARRM